MKSLILSTLFVLTSTTSAMAQSKFLEFTASKSNYHHFFHCSEAKKEAKRMGLRECMESGVKCKYLGELSHKYKSKPNMQGWSDCRFTATFEVLN